MAFRIICGPAGSGKTARAMEAFTAAMRRGDNPVFIAPSMPDARHFERELLRREDCRVISGAMVTTFGGLCRSSLAGAGAPMRQISAVERHLLLRAIVAKEKNRLSFLKDSSAYEGFISSLGKLVADLELAGIGPVELAEAGKIVLNNTALNQDIFRLYQSYQGVLGDGELTDAQLSQWQALAHLQQDPGAQRHGAVIIDGFWDFTPLEHALLKVLRETTRELLLTLPLRKGKAASAAPGIHLDSLPAPDEIQYLGEPATDRRPAALVQLDRRLFEEDAGPIPADGAVRILEGAGVRGQAELVGAEILRLHREGRSLDDIAVVCRSFGEDSRAITAVFDEYGIPCDHQGSRKLVETPVGQAALAALDFLLSDSAEAAPGLNPAGSLLRFLRSFVAGVPERLVDSFAREVSLLGIDEKPQLLEKWRQAAGRGRQELPAPAALGRLEEAAGEGIARLAAELCNFIQAQICGVIPGDAGAAAMNDQEINLLSVKALAEVCAAAAAVSRSFAAKGADAINFLREGIRTATMDPLAGRHRGCVRLLDPHRILNQRFQVVFMCGLLEGRFPAMGHEDVFFSEADRQKFRSRYLLPIESGQYRLEEERFLFHRALTRADQIVYLCYPYCNAEGKQTVRSLFVDQVLELFDYQHSPAIKRRSIADVAFPLEAAPTAREALRSLCLIAGEHTFDKSEGLSGRYEDRLQQAASQAGLEDSLNRCLAAARPCDFSLRDPALLERFQTMDCFSATFLEEYSACPARYFVNRHLQPAPMANDAMALERGRIAHAVLAEFGRKMRSVSVHLGRADAAQLEMAGKFMDDLLGKATEELGSNLDARMMKATLKYYLHRFIELEASWSSSLKPFMFECSFGGEGSTGEKRDHNELYLNLGDGIKLSGKIDRIDVDDITQSEKHALVIDYKMSKSGKGVNNFEKTGKLQIPLYILAVKEIWDLEPVGGQYFALMCEDTDVVRGMCLANADLGERQVVRTDKKTPDDFQEELDKAEARARKKALAIRAARFAPDPLEGACIYCDYAIICRTGE